MEDPMSAWSPAPDDLSEDDIRRRARRRLIRVKAFYSHLVVYAAVNALLHLINLVNGHRYWAIWPLLGWAIAVAIQAASTFQWPAQFLGPDWEARKLREYADAERRRVGITPPPERPPS
jgi:hypothetical protein